MGISTLRLVVWILSLGILGPLSILTCQAAGLEDRTTWIVAAAVAAIAWPLLVAITPRRLGNCDDPESGGRRKLLLTAVVLVGLAAGLRTVGTSTFMLDATDQTYAVHAVKDFGVKHNCFTCLAVGAQLAERGVSNIYDRKHYRRALAPDRTPMHGEIETCFSIDGLPYAPPALLITQILSAKTQSFFELRSYWFAIGLLCLLAALGGSVIWAGGLRNNHSLLLFPGLLLSTALLVTLQIGNIQVLVVSCSVLAMLAFSHRWYGTGGILLGFAILTKIWPAVLLAYLLLGRRWRAVGASILGSAALCLASLAASGTAPFEAFLDYQLPRLLSGEAFSFMRSSSHAMLANMSVFGWPAKLHALDLTEAHSLIPDTLKWSYTGFLAVMVLLVGLRHARDDASYPLTSVRIWLALMVLAEMRSPFLPAGYGALPVLWLLLFLLPGAGMVRGSITFLCLVVVAVQTPLFEEAAPHRFHLWWSLASSAIAFSAATLSLLSVIAGRKAAGDAEDAQQPPAEVFELDTVDSGLGAEA